MTRRRAGWIATGLALLALASVSINRGRTIQVMDMTGAPLQDVLIVYHHEGVGYNPAHATTYGDVARRLFAREVDQLTAAASTLK